LSKYIGKSDGTAERIASNSDLSVLEAPIDGKLYGRKNEDWEVINEDGFVKK
jgi:hypothetical protein